MTRYYLTFAALLIVRLSFGQTECVSHWTKNGTPNLKMDTILSTISFKGIDSLPCSQYGTSELFDYKWYINFYNDQIGNFFSDASCINFAKRQYKKLNQQTYDEIQIVQFELPIENIKKIKSTYGNGYDGYRYFKLNVLTLYKFVIKDNNIYFISTESYHQGENESFLDKICGIFVKS